MLEDGPSAYSSMGLTHDGCLGVLYERGGQISFARIPSHPKGPLGEFSAQTPKPEQAQQELI